MRMRHRVVRTGTVTGGTALSRARLPESASPDPRTFPADPALSHMQVRFSRGLGPKGPGVKTQARPSCATYPWSPPPTGRTVPVM